MLDAKISTAPQNMEAVLRTVLDVFILMTYFSDFTVMLSPQCP